MYQTKYLNETKDFRKSVTLKPEIAAVETMLSSGKNFWRDYLAKWNFLSTTPYGVIARANPKLIEQAAAEAKTRADAEVDVRAAPGGRRARRGRGEPVAAGAQRGQYRAGKGHHVAPAAASPASKSMWPSASTVASTRRSAS